MRVSRRTLLQFSGLAGLSPPASDGAGLPPPDRVTAFTEKGSRELKASGARWVADDIIVTTTPERALRIGITAPKTELTRVRLRWRMPLPAGCRFLGDQWERSYGDLEWRSLSPERILPWYFLASNNRATYGYGVKTGCAALCFWQTDPGGISLWLDVRNGGRGVRLGERELPAASVVAMQVEDGPFHAAQQFCRMLCDHPRLPAQPVYGWNNYYYTYAKNFTTADIVRDSAALTALSPTGENRPYMIIDGGWQVTPPGGPWNRGNAGFPDMPGLVLEMRQAGVRPGIWLRPLYTSEHLPESWRLPDARLTRPAKPGSFIIDPSVPDALDHIQREIRGLARWGFELIKHDYSIYDLLGRWGFEMGAQLTSDGWHFADRSRTTAEIVLSLYRAIRAAAGSAIVIGCNSAGHLAAGLFELQRIGDDNSGREWHRTRRMGVNALAFRMPQQGAFFAVDADCVPITRQVPWEMSRLWLDLLSRSGTPLFVSAHPAELTAEQKNAVRAALKTASEPNPPAEPLDWMETTQPTRWRLGSTTATFDWFGDEGAFPFSK